MKPGSRTMGSELKSRPDPSLVAASAAEVRAAAALVKSPDCRLCGRSLDAAPEQAARRDGADE